MVTIFMFLLSSTPLLLLCLLLFFSLLMALSLTFQLLHTFSGFLLVLLMTGGVLILFSYVVATMSNFNSEVSEKGLKSLLTVPMGFVLFVSFFLLKGSEKSASLTPETSLSEVYLAYSPGVLGGLFVLITLAFIFMTLVLKMSQDPRRKF